MRLLFRYLPVILPFAIRFFRNRKNGGKGTSSKRGR